MLVLRPAGRMPGSSYRLRGYWATRRWSSCSTIPTLSGARRDGRRLLAEARTCARGLGATPANLGATGTAFAVWAPGASRSAWSATSTSGLADRHPIRLRRSTGVWKIYVPRRGDGRTTSSRSSARRRCCREGRSVGAPVEQAPSHHQRGGGAAAADWATASLEARARCQRADAGRIYEVHLGSWRPVGGRPGQPLARRDELADRWCRAREMGFTHLELLPVSSIRSTSPGATRPIGCTRRPRASAAGRFRPGRPLPGRHRRDPRLGARRTSRRRARPGRASTARTSTARRPAQGFHRTGIR